MTFLTSLLCIANIASLQFKGGDDHALVTFLAAYERQSIALLADPSRRWPAREFFAEDKDELKKKLVSFCRGTEGNGWFAAGTATYPLSTCLTQNRSAIARTYQRNTVETKRTSGRVWIESTKGPVSLGQVFSGDLSKPIEWHWYFEGLYMDVNVQGLPEAEFIELVAAAIGAKVRSTSTKYYLDLDPVQVRKRAGAGLTEAAGLEPRRGGRKAAFLFTSEVLRAVSDAAIEKAFESPEQKEETELPIKSLRLRELAYERLKSQFPIEDDGVQRTAADHEMWARVGPLLDRSKQPKAILGPSGVAQAVFYGVNEGKPFRFVL